MRGAVEMMEPCSIHRREGQEGAKTHDVLDARLAQFQNATVCAGCVPVVL